MEIQAIQRALNIEPASSSKTTFNNSVFQPTESFLPSTCVKNVAPSCGINLSQSINLRDSGFGTETMKFTDSSTLSSTASTCFVPRRFPSSHLGEFITDVSGNETRLKSSLQESENRRMVLCEKVNKAEAVIQVRVI